MAHFGVRFAVRRVPAALSLLALALSAPRAGAFDLVNRWSATQIDGGGLGQGDPVTLRWSVVPDGGSYSRSSNSQLIDFLDDGWNVSAANRTPNFENRPWWTVISNAYAQYERVSGVSLVYVAEQTAEGASTGMFGDIRIGGENLDGTPGGALADNTFPDDGDMRIDTTREADGSIGFYFSSEPGLRNLVIHESGHGVGLGHVEFVSGGPAIMEGGLRTDVWGLQFDDVYGLNRLYGDPKERNGGNNIAALATPLGNIPLGGTLSAGVDATDARFEQFDDDVLGIDGQSDADWFSFTIASDGFANIKLTPVGPTYETVQQGVFDAAAQNDLFLQVFIRSQSLMHISTVDATGLGEVEHLRAQYFSQPGEYMLRVRGKQDLNQFYQLDVTMSALPLAGTSADLNLDGVTDAADWTTFVAHSGTSLALYSARDAYMRGDLDADGDNDYADFKFFKTAYDAALGAGAFAALMQVPEPAALGLAGAAIVVISAASRRNRRVTA